jgi:hypothetical protein
MACNRDIFTLQVHHVLASAKRRCDIVTRYQMFEHSLPSNGFLGKKSNIIFVAVRTHKNRCNVQIVTVITYTETLCHLKTHISLDYV